MYFSLALAKTRLLCKIIMWLKILRLNSKIKLKVILQKRHTLFAETDLDFFILVSPFTVVPLSWFPYQIIPQYLSNSSSPHLYKKGKQRLILSRRKLTNIYKCIDHSRSIKVKSCFFSLRPDVPPNIPFVHLASLKTPLCLKLASPVHLVPCIVLDRLDISISSLNLSFLIHHGHFACYFSTLFHLLLNLLSKRLIVTAPFLNHATEVQTSLKSHHWRPQSNN